MDVAQVASGSHAASSALLAWMGQAVVSGTILAALTYILTRLPRLRLGPAVEAALWSIVLVKFLIPVGPASSFSLSSVYQHLFMRSAVRVPMAAGAGVTGVGDFDPAGVDITGRDPAGLKAGTPA